MQDTKRMFFQYRRNFDKFETVYERRHVIKTEHLSVMYHVYAGPKEQYMQIFFDVEPRDEPYMRMECIELSGKYYHFEDVVIYCLNRFDKHIAKICDAVFSQRTKNKPFKQDVYNFKVAHDSVDKLQALSVMSFDVLAEEYFLCLRLECEKKYLELLEKKISREMEPLAKLIKKLRECEATNTYKQYRYRDDFSFRTSSLVNRALKYDHATTAYAY